jgi:glycosyltransferase involved in cell wall biosynthesis
VLVFKALMPSLGLVIPTYNSRRYLERHVEGLLPWLDLVQEIIVVDSHSSDGSADFLRERLPHPNLRIEQHPPGLYASWNHGIGCLQTDYFIMSTTGDTISREGVEKLIQCAVEGQCDIVISKPTFRDLEDRVHEIRWPLDDILEKTPAGGRQFLSGLEALVYAMARPDSALLGSSASNLYRTRFFQERPFPLDWGVGGDGGWVWEHAVEARWGVLRGNFSTFLIHPPQSQKKDLHPPIKQKLSEVLGRSVERWVSQGVVTPNDLGKIGWLSLQKALCNYLDAKDSFDASRRQKGLWILRPSAWMQRSRRKKAAVSLHKARDLALTACQDGKI